MSDLEFTFEDSPLEMALAAAQKNGKLSATGFSTGMIIMCGVTPDGTVPERRAAPLNALLSIATTGFPS